MYGSLSEPRDGPIYFWGGGGGVGWKIFVKKNFWSTLKQEK